MAKTKLKYLTDSYAKEAKAKVVEVISKKDTVQVILSETIFYPQGGGQLADRGTIESKTGTLKVKDVTYNDGAPLHMGSLDGELKKGQSVTLRLDWSWRYKQMQAHTGGHILDEAVKEVAPEYRGVEGQHGIGGKYYIKFEGIIDGTLKNEVSNKIEDIRQNEEPITTRMVTRKQLEKEKIDVPFKLPKNKPLRLLTIGDRAPVPDGGTQLKTTGELWRVALTDFEYSDGQTIIHYAVAVEDAKPLTYKVSSYTYGDFENKIEEVEKSLSAVVRVTEETRIEYLGKKGRINELTQLISKLPNDDKGRAGQNINKLKIKVRNLFAVDNNKIQGVDESARVDVTMPGTPPMVGRLHPISRIIYEVSDIVSQLGFSVASGPEIEWDEINFQKLRLGPDHPSRDTQETYYFDDKKLLRVHTSSVQIRYMQAHKPPIRIISPGRVYRRDTIDATHLPSFHQIEGLMVDEKTTLTDLLGILEHIAKRLFGDNRRVRFYGHNFPYTEPSLEVEVQDGNGKWLEILGCGMVHPEVLENCGIDSKKYQGWAFGMGADRLAMLKYGITDIRDLYSGDLRFLKQ